MTKIYEYKYKLIGKTYHKIYGKEKYKVAVTLTLVCSYTHTNIKLRHFTLKIGRQY